MWMLHASSWFEDVLDLIENTDAEPNPEINRHRERGRNDARGNPIANCN